MDVAAHLVGYGLVVVDERGCWSWHNRKTDSALRRFVFETVTGRKLDRKLVLRPRCDTPGCLNPSHVRVVSAREVVAENCPAFAARMSKVRCERGHDLTNPENVTYSNGKRVCKACLRFRQRRRRVRLRAAT